MLDFPLNYGCNERLSEMGRLSEGGLEKRLSQIIRAQRPIESRESYDPTHPFPSIYYEECLFEGRPYILPMVILRTNPCSWYEKAGGCSTCGYQGIARFNGANDKDILAQVDAALRHLRSKGELPFIHLTSSGSFFDRREVSDAVLEAIAKRMEEAGVRVFSTESRADIINNRERLALFRRHFSGVVSVGIGLESLDEEIRNLCLFKGLKNRSLERAFGVLKDFDFDFHAYLLIGKPFLTPKEDVEDVLSTLHYALDRGGQVLLMLANIQPGTLAYALWKKGHYALPSLWAPIKVLRQLEPEDLSRVVLRGVDKAVPSPNEFQRNCELCTPVVRNALIGFNWTKDPRMLEQAWNCCPCREKWEVSFQFQNDARSIRQRVEDAILLFKDN